MEHQTSSPWIKSANYQKKGLYLIFGPIILVVLVIISWAALNFAVHSLGAATPQIQIIARIINALLGLLGGLSLIVFLFGFQIGIIMLFKRELAPGTPYDERSGKGDSSTVPEEIKGWNWGPVGFPIIWGVYHGVWISLLCMIPFVSLIVRIYLGVKGNELAWKKNKWPSVETFKNSQAKWFIWGVVGVVISALSILSNLFSLAATIVSSVSN